MKKKLYIVRHGQTDWNLERRRQGRTDIELNETGRQQAMELREKIAGIDFLVCYASPLRRAAETAQIICEDRIPIIYDALLVERCFGKTEGLVQDNLPYETEFRFGNKYDDNTEIWEAVLARAEEFLEKIKTGGSKNQNILVVSHGIFLRALHFAIVGYNTKTDFMNWSIGNCEIKEYEI